MNVFSRRPRHVRILLACFLLLPAQHAFAQTYEVLSYTTAYPAGRTPRGGLVYSSADGVFFGTASRGGVYDKGTIFSVDTAGHMTLRHAFNGADGAVPYAGLMRASNGLWYGTTTQGGTGNTGTVFSFDPSTDTVITLRSLTTPDGTQPWGELVEASDGLLYGTAANGGAGGLGAIFRIAPDGSSFSVVHSLISSDGWRPTAALTLGLDGALYGVGMNGGANGRGSVFRITTAGSFSVVFSFTNTSGRLPMGRLWLDSDGAFIGTTSAGEAAPINGTVFRVTTAGAFNVIAFLVSTGPKSVQSGVVRGPDGNLYGTSTIGGDITSTTTGTVFKVVGSGATYLPVRTFGAETYGPYAPLTVGSDGLLYGAASGDFSTGSGTCCMTGQYAGSIFKVNPSGFTGTLVTPMGGRGTGGPWRMIEASPGNWMGIGVFGSVADGLVFGWNETDGVRSLYGGPGDGHGVFLNLHAAPDGTLYAGSGNQFVRLDSTGIPTRLRTFDGTGVGFLREFAPGDDGYIYATGMSSTSTVPSTLFRMDTTGAVTPLYTFSDFEYLDHLIQGAGGYLYGSTWNSDTGRTTVYRADHSGSVSTLHDLTTGEGAYIRQLVQRPDGLLLGVADDGGISNCGTLFSLNPATTVFSVLRQFDSSACSPTGLALESDGSLYVRFGGAGIVLHLNQSGSELWALPGVAVHSEGDLVLGTDGNLYGLGSGGGPSNSGTLFRIRLRRETSTTLSSSPNPSVYSTSVNIAATVSTDIGTPDGTVEFFDGPTSLGTAPVVSGSASINVSTLTTGLHHLAAVYSGSTGFEGSTSPTLDHTVTPATPTITWSDPSSITYGTPLSATQLNATASVLGSFVYAPAAGDVLTVGSHTLSTTFTPTDTTNYTTATASVSITVLPAPPIVVTVTTPNGSDTLYTGSPYTITWSASGGGGGLARFDVQSSINNGVSYTPIAACANLPGTARSCMWPAPGPTGTKARIKVIATDAVSNTQFDASDAAFKIVAGTGTVTVSAPNTAVVFAVGSHQTITWKHNLGLAATFRIEVSRDGGATYPELVAANAPASTASAGTFAWQVTSPVSTTARVRITAVSTPSATDISNVNFTIAAVSVAISAPKGSADWGYGSLQTVTWTTNLGAGDLFDLQMSTDGGATWPLTLAPAVAGNTKSANVTTPTLGLPTTSALVRLLWTNAPSGPTAIAVSPGTFKVDPPFVTVKSPNGGETWLAGPGPKVTWTSNLGKLENVMIELSLDGGATYSNVLLASTPSDGSQAVTVPSLVTTTAKVRITWLKSPGVKDESNAVFRIQ